MTSSLVGSFLSMGNAMVGVRKRCPDFGDDAADVHCCASRVKPGSFYCCDEAAKAADLGYVNGLSPFPSSHASPHSLPPSSLPTDGGVASVGGREEGGREG